MVSILEYDKEWEEKKLRKAEYEAGKEDGKSEGIEIGKTKNKYTLIRQKDDSDRQSRLFACNLNLLCYNTNKS